MFHAILYYNWSKHPILDVSCHPFLADLLNLKRTSNFECCEPSILGCCNKLPIWDDIATMTTKATEIDKKQRIQQLKFNSTYI